MNSSLVCIVVKNRNHVVIDRNIVTHLANSGMNILKELAIKRTCVLRDKFTMKKLLKKLKDMVMRSGLMPEAILNYLFRVLE